MAGLLARLFVKRSPWALPKVAAELATMYGTKDEYGNGQVARVVADKNLSERMTDCAFAACCSEAEFTTHHGSAAYYAELREEISGALDLEPNFTCADLRKRSREPSSASGSSGGEHYG